MKKLITALALTLATNAAAHGGQHPPHKMLLIGETEVFASHIVYTKPHNYQVILQLRWDSAAQEKYLSERHLHPKDQFIYLLDSMDIGEIRSSDRIAGTVYRIDENGNRTDLFPLELAQPRFEVLYFAEIPTGEQS
jgi:hypothetical protein